MKVIRALGLNPDDLFELSLNNKGVHARVIARDDDDRKVLLRKDGETECAEHRIFIEFEH